MTARIALAALAVAALWMLLGRRLRVEPVALAASDDIDWLNEWRSA